MNSLVFTHRLRLYLLIGSFTGISCAGTSQPPAKSITSKLTSERANNSLAKIKSANQSHEPLSLGPEQITKILQEEFSYEPSAEDIEQAKKYLEQGESLYRKGEYNQAEQVLKNALGIYPFLARANLLLGKICLIKGSANRDLHLVQSARFMFEMARTIDPNLREADILLDLFEIVNSD